MKCKKDVREPPNRGYRKKDRIRRRPSDEAAEEAEDRNRRLWLQRQPRAEDLYDEFDRHELNLSREKNRANEN